MTFTRPSSRTVLERSFATSPVKLFTTRNRGEACWVYSATLGGGLVGGDDIRMTLDVQPGARVLLATQASMKVYRSLRPTSQSISAMLARDSLLAVIPDPVVCYAGAHFSQQQRYELDKDANLVLVDWITSGRHASGERWAFARYANRIDITRDGRRILYDAITLERDSDAVADRMGRFDVYLTAVITGPLVSSGAHATIALTSQTPVVAHADLIESAAVLSDGGTLVRMAGTNVENMGRVLRRRLEFLHPFLGDDPWSRKW